MTLLFSPVSLFRVFVRVPPKMAEDLFLQLVTVGNGERKKKRGEREDVEQLEEDDQTVLR